MSEYKDSVSHEKEITTSSDGSIKPSHDTATLVNVADPDDGKSEGERRELDIKLVKKMDSYLVPWLCLTYLACFLDRTNIGNARLAGMEKDLDISGPQYNFSLTIFFISYAGFEPFTNLILERVTPRVFFTVSVCVWGLCMMCTGLVSSYSGLLVARFFLGMCEAGLFPGVQYYLSMWYKRSEVGLRLALFFAMAALAGSFGGLLAAAIAHMDGVGGKSGWAWIFILEGSGTMVVGAFSWFMIFDWPDTARFLAPDERLRVRHRLAKGNLSNRGSDYDKRHVTEALKDWKTWVFGVMDMGNFMVLYAFSLFLPTILEGMGYEGTHAQLLSVPPYAVAALNTIFIGWLADRTRQRGICNMCLTSITVVGFIMLIATDNPHIQYAGTFLGAFGLYPTIPNNISWAANNVEGGYKRGVVLGIMVGLGNVNGIVSSNIYMKKEKPHYRTGHAVVLGYLIILHFGATALMRTKLALENKRRRQGLRDHILDGLTEDEIVVMGDKRPDFMYTL